MSCPLWFDTEMSVGQYLLYTKPVVYALFREHECLYVGKSSKGLSRPLDKSHHVFSLIELMPCDYFKFFFPPIKDEQELLDVEALYIKELKPRYNESSSKKNKKDLAESASRLLSENQLVSVEGIASLTDEELRNKIKQLRQAQQVLEKLQK